MSRMAVWIHSCQMADAASLMLDSAGMMRSAATLRKPGNRDGRHYAKCLLSLVVRAACSLPPRLASVADSRRALRYRWACWCRSCRGALLTEPRSYLWLYVNNWDWTDIHNSGFWRELAACAPGLALVIIALACWSWTTGLLVGCFTRRILWLSGGARSWW